MSERARLEYGRDKSQTTGANVPHRDATQRSPLAKDRRSLAAAVGRVRRVKFYRFFTEFYSTFT